MFAQKLRFGCKFISIGFGVASSYLAIHYQQTVGVKSEVTVQENIEYIQKWLKWKFDNTMHLTEECIMQFCHWCSLTPWFHYLDLTSLLIFLANRKNALVHDLGVKLLTAVDFPTEANISHYIKQCSDRVMIGLARSDNIDLKWFSWKQEVNEKVSDKVIEFDIDNILTDIKSLLTDETQDACSEWLYEKVIQQFLPSDPVTNVMVDLSSVRDNLELTADNEISFSENIFTYLEILRRYSNNDSVSSNALISRRILQVIKNITTTYEEDRNVLIACGNIIANLAVNDMNRKAILDCNVLGLLMNWRKSQFISLQVTASRILNNLDTSDSNIFYLDDGIYILHPECRYIQPSDIDIIFLHGIRGSPFYTWRQGDAIIDGYTYCWPKDWLSIDYPNMRVISVEYKSSISDWHLSCPLEKNERCLDKQAENIGKKLMACGVGKRPIIWVAHSMGGLMVKKILLDDKFDTFCNSTEGIVFYSVPHLGSPIATQSEKVRYILFPSTEVNELSENSENLKDLHHNFFQLLKEKSIDCIDFGESKPLSLPYVKVKSLVVPRASSDVGYGRYLLADANHQDICKPVSKSDPRYLEVTNVVKKILRKHFPFKENKEK